MEIGNTKLSNGAPIIKNTNAILSKMTMSLLSCQPLLSGSNGGSNPYLGGKFCQLIWLELVVGHPSSYVLINIDAQWMAVCRLMRSIFPMRVPFLH